MAGAPLACHKKHQAYLSDGRSFALSSTPSNLDATRKMLDDVFRAPLGCPSDGKVEGNNEDDSNSNWVIYKPPKGIRAFLQRNKSVLLFR